MSRTENKFGSMHEPSLGARIDLDPAPGRLFIRCTAAGMPFALPIQRGN
jgi:hypothetical protein